MLSNNFCLFSNLFCSPTRFLYFLLTKKRCFVYKANWFELVGFILFIARRGNPRRGAISSDHRTNSTMSIDKVDRHRELRFETGPFRVRSVVCIRLRPKTKIRERCLISV